MTNPASLDASAAAERIQQGKLRPVELAEACLDAIEARDGVLNAFVHVDRALSVRAARDLERGAPRGALHGLPVAVKDVLDTADMPTGYGSPIWTGYKPRADAVSVALARQSGAVVIGKTATTEFATKYPAKTVNPANHGHTPGGSSSGSAAAVAAGLCPLAFATQTAGSIIRPASFCGIVGFKPTFGSVHRAGMKVMSEALDTIGFLARNVRDCTLFATAITGIRVDNPETPPARAPRFAFAIGPSQSALPETRTRLQEMADILRGSGAEVAHVPLPQELDAAFHAHTPVMNFEIWKALSWEIATHPDKMSEDLRGSIESGQSAPSDILESGTLAFERGRSAFSAFMRDYDALITPSAIGEAPEGLRNTGDPIYDILWTALHVPCINLPMGKGPRGLPLGLQLVADRYQDSSLLRWARWVEARIS